MVNDSMTLDERDRLTRLESKLDFLIEKVDPILEQHTKFIETMKERIAWIGGAFAVLGAGVTFLANWLIVHLNSGGGHG